MQITDPSVESLASTVTAVPSGPDTLSLSLSADVEAKQVLVSVFPPAKPQPQSEKGTAKRASLDICCVIDVSGSMSSEAIIPADPAAGTREERTGLSILDVVKHALRTIIATMQEGKDWQLKCPSIKI